MSWVGPELHAGGGQLQLLRGRGVPGGWAPHHAPPQGAPPTKTVLGSMPSAIPHKTQTAISVMATTAQLVGVLY